VHVVSFLRFATLTDAHSSFLANHFGFDLELRTHRSTKDQIAAQSWQHVNCPFLLELGLLELGRNIFSVLQVSLKDLKASLQQALEFGIARRRNECAREGVIDGLVVSDLV
jgi:hypothetical protein